MSLESDLRKEIAKWTQRLERELPGIKAGEKGAAYLLNIQAYVKDSKHFAEKGDLIRSFEAIVWGWAWLEIAKELGLLE
jgi:hypothetical protein